MANSSNWIFPAFMPGQQERMASQLSQGFGGSYQDNYDTLSNSYGDTEIKATGNDWIDRILGVPRDTGDGTDTDTSTAAMSYEEWLSSSFMPNRSQYPNEWDEQQFREEYDRQVAAGTIPASSTSTASSGSGLFSTGTGTSTTSSGSGTSSGINWDSMYGGDRR